MQCISRCSYKMQQLNCATTECKLSYLAKRTLTQNFEQLKIWRVNFFSIFQNLSDIDFLRRFFVCILSKYDIREIKQHTNSKWSNTTTEHSIKPNLQTCTFSFNNKLTICLIVDKMINYPNSTKSTKLQQYIYQCNIINVIKTSKNDNQINIFSRIKNYTNFQYFGIKFSNTKRTF